MKVKLATSQFRFKIYMHNEMSKIMKDNVEEEIIIHIPHTSKVFSSLKGSI